MAEGVWRAGAAGTAGGASTGVGGGSATDRSRGGAAAGLPTLSGARRWSTRGAGPGGAASGRARHRRGPLGRDRRWEAD